MNLALSYALHTMDQADIEEVMSNKLDVYISEDGIYSGIFCTATKVEMSDEQGEKLIAYYNEWAVDNNEPMILKPTWAQQISRIFDDDGQSFESTDGTDLIDICDKESSAAEMKGVVTRYIFPDGSAFVINEGATWDIGFTCCFGWEANGHDKGCPGIKEIAPPGSISHLTNHTIAHAIAG